MRLQPFKERYKCPNSDIPNIREPVSNNRLDEIDVFFFRQRYNRKIDAGGVYAPELRPSCVCRKILNPDDETIACQFCQSYMHPVCLRQNADRRCYECKNEIPIKLINQGLKRHAMEGDSKAEVNDDAKLQEEDVRQIKRQKTD